MAADDGDKRSAIYEDLHAGQLAGQEAANRASAQLILQILFEHYRPASVLDVGCGLGTWLAVAGELGVKDYAGVDGTWMDRKLAQVPAERIRSIDLEKPFDLGRRYDLVICLEVAEHLSADAAAGFVGSLTRHADVVLFSAAIPLQGGHHHVNEQFPDYWEQLFEQAGYGVADFLRPQIWNSREVFAWLRQNILVFAKKALLEGRGPFAELAAGGPLALVHPEMYLERLGQHQAAADQHAMLMELMMAGKSISLQRNPDGSLTLQTSETGKG